MRSHKKILNVVYLIAFVNLLGAAICSYNQINNIAHMIGNIGFIVLFIGVGYHIVLALKKKL